jgi:hypothetical protein
LRKSSLTRWKACKARVRRRIEPELGVLFVRWAVYQELAASESSDPDPTSLVSETLELNASQAERLYRKQLQEALLAEGDGGVVAWEVGRVY